MSFEKIFGTSIHRCHIFYLWNFKGYQKPRSTHLHRKELLLWCCDGRWEWEFSFNFHSLLNPLLQSDLTLAFCWKMCIHSGSSCWLQSQHCEWNNSESWAFDWAPKHKTATVSRSFSFQMEYFRAKTRCSYRVKLIK